MRVIKGIMSFVGGTVKMALGFVLARIIIRVFSRFGPLLFGASIPFWSEISEVIHTFYEIYDLAIGYLDVFNNDVSFLLLGCIIVTILSVMYQKKSYK